MVASIRNIAQNQSVLRNDADTRLEAKEQAVKIETFVVLSAEAPSTIRRKATAAKTGWRFDNIEIPDDKLQTIRR